MNPRVLWSLVFGLVVVGALLRFQGVTDQSFASEEIFEVLWTEGSLGELRANLLQDRRSPPLYHLALMPFTHRGEGAMTAVRLPSVLCGILLPLVLFGWLRAACGSTVAITAMALMVFSPLHVRFSQDATPYSLLTLAGAAAAASLWMAARSQRRGRWLLAYALSLWVAMWTHYLAVLLVGLHLIWIWSDWLCHRRDRESRGAWAPLGVTVAGLLGIASLQPRLMELWMEMGFWTGSETGFPFAGWSLEDALALLGAFTFGSAATDAAVPMGIVAVPLLVIGLVRLLRTQPSLAALLLLLSVGNVAAVLALCATQNHWFGERFVLLSLPAHVVWLAVGLATLLEWVGLLLASVLRLRSPAERAIAVGGLSLAVLMAGGALALRLIIARPHLKPEWQEAAQWIAENLEPGAPILAAHPWDLFCLEHHLELIDMPVRTWLIPEGGAIRIQAEALGNCLILLPAWDMHRTDWGQLSTATSVGGFRGIHMMEWSDDPLRWVERRAPMMEEAASAFREAGDRLDIGEEPYPGVGPGWWPPEVSSGGESFRWMAQERAAVLLPFNFPRGASLAFRAKAFTWPEMPAQPVEVAVNGVTIGRDDVSADWSTFSVDVPATAWKPGANIVEFRSHHLAAPAEVIGGDDDRVIGVALDWVGLGDEQRAEHDWTGTISLEEEPLLLDAAARTFAHSDHLLDVGSEPFGAARADDWHAPEQWLDDFSVRWSRRETAGLLIPLAESGAWDLLLRASTLDWPGAPPQRTAILLNGERIGGLTISPEWTVHRVPISGEQWQAGLNTLEFEVDHVVSPEAVMEIPDPRPLGIALDWIQLIARESDER